MQEGFGIGKAAPTLLRRLLLLLLPLAFGGCQHTVTPPAAVSDPVTVFVIDYGRHASLALPAGDEGGLVEWSWGDWNWFARERTGALDGLQALFASPRSTLSRRSLPNVGGAAELQERVGAQEVLGFDVERWRGERLRRRLEERWEPLPGESVIRSGGRVFAPDDARYSLFNNSVHELARWLEELGADVSGTAFTASYTLREPRPR
jgi:hypothetical protein